MTSTRAALRRLALQQWPGNIHALANTVARAARLLGMTPRQIAYRIQTLNIEVKQI